MHLTIIIPTRNRSDSLVRCLDTLSTTLVVVVDDGSDSLHQAATESICAASTDVRLLRQELPVGAAAARNRGARHANTEWLLFLDDDDQLMDGFLTSMSRLVEERPAVNAWVPDVLGAKSRACAPVELKDLQARNRAGGCSGFLIRKALFEEVGGFDAEFCSMQDWDLWIRLVQGNELYYSGVCGIVYDSASQGKITHNLCAKYRGLRRLYLKHRMVWIQEARLHHLVRCWSLRQLLRMNYWGFISCMLRVHRWPLAMLYYLRWRKYR